MLDMTGTGPEALDLNLKQTDNFQRTASALSKAARAALQVSLAVLSATCRAGGGGVLQWVTVGQMMCRVGARESMG
jgi:hypothetical protein